MKTMKSILALLLVCVMALALAACGGNGNTTKTDEPGKQEEPAKQEEPGKQDEQPLTDQEKADEVAALIDAIYVQERNDQTDEQCAAAKAAWDALTDEQKELVEGENADPDYFGRDTGDASQDNPRNGDEIG